MNKNKNHIWEEEYAKQLITWIKTTNPSQTEIVEKTETYNAVVSKFIKEHNLKEFLTDGRLKQKVNQDKEHAKGFKMQLTKKEKVAIKSKDFKNTYIEDVKHLYSEMVYDNLMYAIKRNHCTYDYTNKLKLHNQLTKRNK